MRRILPADESLHVGTADEVIDDGITDEEIAHAYAYPVGTTWTRANMVAAVDSIATVHGLSAGLSGSIDKRVFGILRALADVVVAGAGTVRTEGYRGARVPERFAQMRADLGQARHPPVAIISRQLGLDPGAPVFTDTHVRPLVLTCAAAPDERRANLADVAEVVDCGETDVDLVLARAALEERGLSRILCEGGPTLLHGLVDAGVLDELCLTISPQLVGGGERHVLNGMPFPRPAALRLVGVLEQEGVLLTRYQLDHTGEGVPG
jgi:riboflavin biosynthesis pyrimidine reductase